MTGSKRKYDPLARYEVEISGCWRWQGPLVSGYGCFNVAGSTVMAHRAFYEHHVGPIPDGLQIDHLCRNRACVNPDHLEPVTIQVNLRRGAHPNMVAWRNNACRKGHPYTPENTWRDPKRGTRHCRTCRAQTMRRLRARQTGDAA